MGGLLAAEVVFLPPSPPETGRPFRHRILGTINFDVPFLGLHPGVIGSGIASLFRPAPEQPNTDIAGDTPIVPLSPTSTSSLNDSDSIASGSSGRKRHDTLFTKPEDPNFNPAYPNDVNLKVRKGWRSFAHFVSKHSDGLRKATTQYVKSHLEFGGAMADYPNLKWRYTKVRALEEVDESARTKPFDTEETSLPRVRFVNYYTASNGRPKKERTPSPSRSLGGSDGTLEPPDVEMRKMRVSPSPSRSSSRSPRISIEERRDDGEVVVKEIIDPTVSPTSPENDPNSKQPDEEIILSPVDIGQDTASLLSKTASSLATDPDFQLPHLPPIPDEPTEPPPLDLTLYPDKDAQKLAQKQHDRTVRAYKQAVKDRDEAIRDRQKLIEKLKKAAAKEEARKQKKSSKASLAENETAKSSTTNIDGTDDSATASVPEQTPENDTEAPPLTQKSLDTYPLSQQTTAAESLGVSTPFSPSSPTSRDPSGIASTSSLSPSTTKDAAPEKPKKDRKFCLLAKDDTGDVDRAWVRVYMSDVDEVVAHTSLFYFSESYERLVGDVAGRVEEWVREDASRRVVEEEHRGEGVGDEGDGVEDEAVD